MKLSKIEEVFSNDVISCISIIWFNEYSYCSVEKPPIIACGAFGSGDASQVQGGG